MTVETKKTGQFLRKQLQEGSLDTRLFAVHALSHGYNRGSEAAMANLLLAALGGADAQEIEVSVEQESSAPKRVELIMQPGSMAPALLGQIADPMTKSANDDDYGSFEVVSAS